MFSLLCNIFKDYSFYKKNGAYRLSYDSNVFHQKRSFNIKYITTNTLNISSNNYLYKTLNATFTKMKRTASLKRNNNFNN